MISKWFKLKSKAINLRMRGKSIRYIESTLGIPRSTLSGWLKEIILTKKQYILLKEKHKKSLIRARKKAILWHHKQKKDRLKTAETEANQIISKIGLNFEIIELALALLYLGEGFKKGSVTGIGNSDPIILRFFLVIMTNIYKIDIRKIRFELHLREDQNIMEMKKYWSKELNAPIDRFMYTYTDKRTKNKPTYHNYMGVCVINCYNVAIQRRLIYIGKKFCEKVIEKCAISSIGRAFL